MGINAIFKRTAKEAFEKALPTAENAVRKFRHGRFITTTDAKLTAEIRREIAKAAKENQLTNDTFEFLEKVTKDGKESYIKHVIEFINKDQAKNYKAFLDNFTGYIVRLFKNQHREIDLTSLKGGQLVRDGSLYKLAKTNFIKNSNSAFSNIMKHDAAKIKEDLGTLENNGIINRVKGTGIDTVEDKFKTLVPDNYTVENGGIKLKDGILKPEDFADANDKKYLAALKQLLGAEGLGAKRIVLEGLDQPTYINTFKAQLKAVAPKMKDGKAIDDALMNAHTIDELYGMIDTADRVKFDLAFNKALVTDFLNKDAKNAEKLFTFTAPAAKAP